MDISADFISSVLFTPDNTSTRITDSNNNHNHNLNHNQNNHNNGTNNNSSHNNNCTEPTNLNNGIIPFPTTDIQELHLLGLHFDEFESLPNEQIRLLPTAETNNNHFVYTNSPTFDSAAFNCSTTYDAKSQISWTPTSNTDGAIYSFEIVSDNTNTSPFWEDDNLSPITTVLHQPNTYQNNTVVGNIDIEHNDSTRLQQQRQQPQQTPPDDNISGSSATSMETTIVASTEVIRSEDDYENINSYGNKTTGTRATADFESANLLLRNALLGKANSRYNEQIGNVKLEMKNEPHHENSIDHQIEFNNSRNTATTTTATTPKQENQNETRLEQVFSVVSKHEHESIILPNIINRRTDHLVDQSANVFNTAAAAAAATDLNDSTGSSHLDEILLSDFDSFSAYSDEQLAGINHDIAQAIQQICNSDQNFISYIPPPPPPPPTTTTVADAVVTTNTAPTSDSIIQNQIPPSKVRRTTKKYVPNRLKTNHSHNSNSLSINSNNKNNNNCNNSDISISDDFSCSSNINEDNDNNNNDVRIIINVNSINNIGNNNTTNVGCNNATGKCNSSNLNSNPTSMSSISSSTGGSNNSCSIVSNGGNNTTTTNNNNNTNGCVAGIRKERSLHHCFVCNKGFKDKYSVNVHIRTHTGEKPFSCTVCAKRFRQKAHLAKHQHTHFQKKTLPPSPTSVLATGTQSTIIKVSTNNSVPMVHEPM